LRHWIGDEAVSAIRFSEGIPDDTKKQELANAFPEATLMERLPNGDHHPWHKGSLVTPDSEER
jgi:hypothetical protein